MVPGRRGRLAIPAEVRAALGLVPGQRLRLRTEGGRLVLERPGDAVSELRGLAAGVPRDRSLVEELPAERRAEARTEWSSSTPRRSWPCSTTNRGRTWSPRASAARSWERPTWREVVGKLVDAGAAVSRLRPLLLSAGVTTETLSAADAELAGALRSTRRTGAGTR
ncbi:looped-hinge helix DNA binding domain-containing protein, AbrB family [Geodermatophilus saharensis]|uniref:Looped-hinge helix DNA binding domain-containing protein, AbrB family n=1 Tax=Geodermatophilus saharensis TaxID=1137994 RepID=A0A239H4V7_9ACTN|nr:looped-hinge helix DNA binding domain-containing protein, AbrB family [Geodermatophilus saharensis]